MVSVTHYEILILTVLQYSARKLNTKDIAYSAKMDYATANKYLHGLLKKNMVYHKKIGRINYWECKEVV